MVYRGKKSLMRSPWGMELQEHLEYIRAGCLEEAKCGDKRMSRKERARAQEAGNRDQRITKMKDLSSKGM